MKGGTAQEHDPGVVHFYFIGFCTFSLDRRHLRRAVALNPGHELAHLNVAEVLLKQGEHDEAIRTYKVILRKFPRSAQAYYGLGYSYHKKGEIALAIEAYASCLKYD